MVEAFNNARSQDTNLARYEVPTFVPLDALVDIVQPPITNNKSTWGFNHPITGKLLCPLQLIPEYEEDPMWAPITYATSWIEGLTHFTDYSRTRLRMWQSGCMPMINENGHHSSTPQELSIMSTSLTRIYSVGRFLSEYVLSPFALSNSQLKYLQTLWMIYRGKSSVFTSHRSAPKPSQAEMHGMHEVFPKAVAYAAVQVSYTIIQSSPSHSISFAGLLQPLLPRWLEHRGSVLQTQCFLRQVC